MSTVQGTMIHGVFKKILRPMAQVVDDSSLDPLGLNVLKRTSTQFAVSCVEINIVYVFVLISLCGIKSVKYCCG